MFDYYTDMLKELHMKRTLKASIITGSTLDNKAVNSMFEC